MLFLLSSGGLRDKNQFEIRLDCVYPSTLNAANATTQQPVKKPAWYSFNRALFSRRLHMFITILICMYTVHMYMLCTPHSRTSEDADRSLHFDVPHKNLNVTNSGSSALDVRWHHALFGIVGKCVWHIVRYLNCSCTLERWHLCRYVQ